MNTERNRHFFSGHGKWALPLAALAAYMANPALGLAAAVVLGALWLAESRAAAAYSPSRGSDTSLAASAPRKREIMRCWTMMF